MLNTLKQALDVTGTPRTIDDAAKKVGAAMLGALVAGDIIAGSWNPAFWSATLMWAAALSAIGWLLGFLFGVPRSLAKGVQAMQATVGASAKTPTPAPTPTPEVATVAPTSGSRSNASMGVNTNLEEISDWLTKIIVGVTLVELDKTQAHLYAAAQLIAGSLGGATAVSFAYALMLYFSISGFLGSYLLTRLYLQKALANVS